MSQTNKLKSILQSSWFIAFITLCIFMITVGYKYAWDDQHIEIPLLKSLINPHLYPGDYYVESLKHSFVSYFYPILSRCITVDQIPATYFILFLIVRYFLFFWIYKIWLLLTGDKFKAFICILVFIFVSRVDEFLYKTLSHQEFALAIIFAGIYYFFKERFVLSAIILGIAANFHALYSLFPFFYMCVYLVWDIKKWGFKTLLKTGTAFVICSLPFLIWMLFNRCHHAYIPPEDYKDWIDVYHYACPQNFLLPLVPVSQLFSDLATFLNSTRSYLILIGFYFLNVLFNDAFRLNKKVRSFCVGGFILLGVCFIFTYIKPNKFFLDMNLTRNTQFLHFILMGFTSILLMHIIEKHKPIWGYCFAVLFVFMKYSGIVSTFAVYAALFVMLIRQWIRKPNRPLKILVTGASAIGLILSLAAIVYSYHVIAYKFFVLMNLLTIVTLQTVVFLGERRIQNPIRRAWVNRLLYLIPLAVFFFQYTVYNAERIHQTKYGGGFWKMRRSWEDVQKFVKAKTPIDAVILVPYNVFMGGFRIYSERPIVVSERDCGIVGFDYGAIVEWKKRSKEIRKFSITPITSPTQAIKTAIMKYGADYVLFMRYAAPQNSSILKKIYTNMDFVLYKVTLPNFALSP